MLDQTIKGGQNTRHTEHSIAYAHSIVTAVTVTVTTMAAHDHTHILASKWSYIAQVNTKLTLSNRFAICFRFQYHIERMMFVVFRHCHLFDAAFGVVVFSCVCLADDATAFVLYSFLLVNACILVVRCLLFVVWNETK